MTKNFIADENGRIAALHRYQIEDSGKDPISDEVTRVAQLALDVPMAALVLIDREMGRFKSARGLAGRPLARGGLFCNEVVKTGASLNVFDAGADPRFKDHVLVTGAPFVRACLGAPLLTPDGYAIGALCVGDTRPHRFEERHIGTIEGLARLVVDQFELNQIAKQDFLTGALTRRGFQQELHREFMRSSRYERPAALVFLDIDHFRKINDAFGHLAGDEALKAVAQACLGVMRQSDVFGRTGGEEFAFILPETRAHEAMQCAERIREVIEKLRFKIGDKVLDVTASFGVAALSARTRNAPEWSSYADKALYEAKRVGRNCCVLAVPEPLEPVLPLAAAASKPSARKLLH